MNKTKISLVFVLLFVFSFGLAYADAEDFTEAKELIDAKTPCSQLTEIRLEIIGDYLMEQMHPGEAHGAMDKMMGGEGSESLRLMHIAMAKRLYCNDFSGMADYGFGGMMSLQKGGMTGSSNFGYWSFLNFLTTLLVVGLVVLVYLWIVKLWREIFGKKR